MVASSTHLSPERDGRSGERVKAWVVRVVGERGHNNAPDGGERGGHFYRPKQRVHFLGRRCLVTGGTLVAMGMVRGEGAVSSNKAGLGKW